MPDRSDNLHSLIDARVAREKEYTVTTMCQECLEDPIKYPKGLLICLDDSDGGYAFALRGANLKNSEKLALLEFMKHLVFEDMTVEGGG